MIADRVKELVRVPARQLAGAPWNWRLHPSTQADAVKASLSELGIYAPLLGRRLADGTVELIDGHLRQVIFAGLSPDTLVPVVLCDLDESEARKANLLHDPLSALAEADPAKLEELLRGVQTSSADLTAVLGDLAAGAGLEWGPLLAFPAAGGGGDEFDATPQDAGPTRANLGDLWAIRGGTLEHRLLVGDCTLGNNVARVMEGATAFLMATDPPYGVSFGEANHNPRAKEWDAVAGDDLRGDGLKDFLLRMFACWLPCMSEQAAFYFWTAALQEGTTAAAAIREAGLHIQSQIIWNKNCMTLGQADYQWKHENAWYAFWKGAKHRWFGDRDKVTVWDIPKIANADYEHPTQKPVELFAIPIRHHTQPGEVVAEPFMGSGSQLIAAHRLGRACYGCELEPRYADVILRRAEAEGLTCERL